MSYVKFDEENELYCEVSGRSPRPLLPARFRDIVIQTMHSFDHGSISECLRRISDEYYWPNLKNDVKHFVKTCDGCRVAKPAKSIQSHSGKFPLPAKRFADLSCDVVGPLPKSNGYSYLFTCVDRVTKWAEAIPLTEASSEACADALLHGWIQRFGCPHSISSDQGNTFIASLWQSLQKTLDVQVKFSPLYSPQSNGLIERQHRANDNIIYI